MMSISLCADSSSLFLQFMPRTGVDDLAGWTQIAPPSAVDGLTTCTTHTVAQQLVLTGFLLLLFIFLMMNFNGLWPLETAQDGIIDPLQGFSVTGERVETWPGLMNWPGCWTRRHFLQKKRRRRRGKLFQQVKSLSKCKAGLHWTLIYTTNISCYMTLHHIKSLPWTSRRCPALGEYDAAL